MAEFIKRLVENALLTTIVLMVVGAVPMLLGIDTPGAVAFMRAGMLIMYVSGRRATSRTDRGAHPAPRNGTGRQAAGVIQCAAAARPG